MLKRLARAIGLLPPIEYVLQQHQRRLVKVIRTLNQQSSDNFAYQEKLERAVQSAVAKGCRSHAVALARELSVMQKEQMQRSALAAQLRATVFQLQTMVSVELLNETMENVGTVIQAMNSSLSVDRMKANIQKFEQQKVGMDFRGDLLGDVFNGMEADMGAGEQEAENMVRRLADKHAESVRAELNKVCAPTRPVRQQMPPHTQ